MRDEELIVEFALTRLDHPGLDLEETAALLVRRVGPEQMLEFSDFGFYYLEDAEVIAPGIALPEGAVPGGRVPEPEFDWVSQFASA